PIMPGPPNPPPNGDASPSGLYVSLKSNNPLRSVLSNTGRPTCPASMFTSIGIGTPDAESVNPEGLGIIENAPRGSGPRGSKPNPRGPAPGSPRWPAAPGGTIGVWSSDSLIFGPSFPTTRL